MNSPHPFHRFSLHAFNHIAVGGASVRTLILATLFAGICLVVLMDAHTGSASASSDTLPDPSHVLYSQVAASPVPTEVSDDSDGTTQTDDGQDAQADQDQAEPVQETLEAQVISAEPPQPCSDSTTDPTAAPGAEAQRCQKVALLITDGSIKGQRVMVEEGRVPIASKANTIYNTGDRVLVDYLHGGGQPSAFYIVDFIRTGQLWVLALVFMGLSIVFGGWRGLTSLVGLAISFAVLIFYMLPHILAGDDPVLIAIISGFATMLVTLYLSHGFNLKTTAALAGTTMSLVLTGVLAGVSVDFLKLSGFGSDEATFVQIQQGGSVDVQGLLLAGIIIGALGVLDDVTIGQSAAVFELRNVNPGLPWRRLFSHATNIGKDHIAATVNTLVMAYAGASLPLLVLFAASAEPWTRVLNQEIVAEEVVRTLVGSIGLIAAVPFTTWIAAIIAVRTPPRPNIEGEEPSHPHSHVHSH